MATEKNNGNTFDVIMVGAGISGINTAYHVQTRCPGLSYTILEGREVLGGTWSLFKYPGIRSDSDLVTFGFSWEPWEKSNLIAEGDSIVDYLTTTAKKYHIDEKIQYRHFVDKLEWNSTEERWTLYVTHDGKPTVFNCKYVVMGTGYYDYKQPLPARIPGLDNFQGKVIHPQFWPEDLDYANKKILIVGSGATAVTLLPALAKKAERVTQVQRSPGYFLVLPDSEPMDDWMKAKLPFWLSRRLIRAKYVIGAIMLYQVCRLFPNFMRKTLRKEVKSLLPPGADIDPHFAPSYAPWDQRICITPGGDYFKALRGGNADVKTGQIQTVTEDGMILSTGEELKADIIITATGLKIQVAGGAKLAIDGKEINLADKFMWKGTMLQDVPNLWYILGYANASWTLAAEASARLMTRMVNDVESKGRHSVVPYLNLDEQKAMEKDSAPLFPLTSTYLNNPGAVRTMPRAGKWGNWKPKENYLVDMFRALYGSITSGVQYR